ncbi:metalloregulator ArsR/SmtB family transcription factor [Thiomicrorhabdus sp. 6S3-12]|uniref:ArsR/SmtB family transcription factor n=1 Tax=Thiomicrorhabdus sp. 6S3-12 TaxID=2819681 RepID=UPI001AACC5B8|nr:metalloregulator ArsR/SmtB family transcription factor [Thiomicrorhabdus sp. 6S3-12]MBO1924793.1 metalloregulator ArsR/SmtB family transcription factor [Thiomicrorhabdus sp. 6S3-12]
MTTDNLKLCLFEQLAQIGKSMGHANRLLILDILAQAPTQVETLSQKLNLSLANVSKHLQHLKQSGLVVCEIQGKQRIYRLSEPSIVTLVQTMRHIAENQMAEVSTILNEKLQPRAPLTPFNPKEIKKALQTESITLLDVRPEDEYQAGHIDGAINIPIEELSEQIKDLSRDKPVIVYCRGPYCLWSYEAVENLRQHDFDASRMADGYPDWEQIQ